MRDPFRKWVAVLFFLFHCGNGQASCTELDFIMRRVRSSCVVAYLTNDCNKTDENDVF